MPVIGALLVTLFAGLAEFFAKYVTRKVAVVGAGITLFLTMTTALWVGLGAAITGLAVALPSNSALLTGMWIAIPDNAPAVVAACLSADAVIAVYRMNVMNVMFGVYGS